jgi:hypothetical protein
MHWYLLSMLTVAPFPTTDNDRYPDLRPTGLHDYLVEAHRTRRQPSTRRTVRGAGGIKHTTTRAAC